MRKIKVLVIGGGGREHALCWAITQSSQLDMLYCAPGNAGIAELATLVDIQQDDVPALLSFAEGERIDLTVVGPEAPLALGVVDAFQQHGLRIFGPTSKAARLETSKAFCKEFMRKYYIPTAPYRIFDNPDDALKFVTQSDRPLVVKADGLAAGKGVLICRDSEEASAAVKTIMVERVFGNAGNRVVIESCLDGDEMSVMAFADGQRVAMMVPARDYKRVGDGDRGPNTGGMGTYAPSRSMDDEVLQEILESVLDPAVAGLNSEGSPYVGVLYAGLMLTDAGPKVLEFNCRFGDPETQVVLPLLGTDILDVFGAALAGQLDAEPLKWRDAYCACVILASQGYPGKYEKGIPIDGRTRTQGSNGTFCFHAGTARDSNNKLVTSGGRVLGVCSRADTHEGAVASAYSAIEHIRIKGAHYRTDIGVRAGTTTPRRRPVGMGRRRR